MVSENSDKKNNISDKKKEDELIEETNDSEKLLMEIATPSIEQVQTDMPEIVALKRKQIEDGLQNKFNEEMKILKRHIVGRLTDCGKKEDYKTMIKESDESKLQLYFNTVCPPPKVGGNKRKYDLLVRYNYLIERSKNVIREIQGEAAKQRFKLKTEV